MLLFSDLLNADGDILLQQRQRGVAYSIFAQHALGLGCALVGCFVTPLGGWKVTALTVSFALHWWGRIRLDRLKDETKVLGDVLTARDFARVDGIEAVMQAQLATLQSKLGGGPREGQLLLPPATEAMPLFDWDELRTNPNKHPHLIVLGESGSGKTELGEWLVDLIGQGADVKVLTTKQRQCQWRGMPVVGIGRDFAAIERDLQGLLGEMTERSRNIDAVEQKPILIRAIDELPAIAENIIGAADPKTGKYKGLATYTKPLVLEARETRIRLILHAQGKQVKLLGFEGMSDCLDSLTHIRLGDAAIKHAKTLNRQKELSDEAYTWLKQQNRPVMVDNCPAEFPIPSNWQPAGQYAVSPPPKTADTGWKHLDKTDYLNALFGKNPFPEPGDKNYLELMQQLFPEMTDAQQQAFLDSERTHRTNAGQDGVDGVSPSYPDPDTNEDFVSPSYPEPKALPEAENSQIGYDADTYLEHWENTPETVLYQQIRKGYEDGLSASDIIKQRLHKTKPEAYRVGKATFIYLVRKYGSVDEILAFRKFLEG